MCKLCCNNVLLFVSSRKQQWTYSTHILTHTDNYTRNTHKRIERDTRVRLCVRVYVILCENSLHFSYTNGARRIMQTVKKYITVEYFVRPTSIFVLKCMYRCKHTKCAVLLPFLR